VTKKSDDSGEPLGWRVTKGLDSRLRKRNLLGKFDPKADRERSARLAVVRSEDEAIWGLSLYQDKVDKHLLEQKDKDEQARKLQRREDEKKRVRDLRKAGRRRTIEMAKGNHLVKSGIRKPTKGDIKGFVAGNRALEQALKERRPGLLSVAPVELAFEELYRGAHTRLGVRANTFRDAYGLGRDLARDSKTLNELEVARFLVIHSFPFGELFERFMRESYVPGFNRLFKPLRRCEECWRTFVPADQRDRFCNDDCSSRSRNRGLQRKGSGKSAVENALAKDARLLKAHWANCAICKAGKFCQIQESRLQKGDALSRMTESYEDSKHATTTIEGDPESEQA